MCGAAFQIGDRLMYGANGICVVADIRAIDEDAVRRCYILQPDATPGVSISVPLDSPTLTAKMRRLMTKDEVDALLCSVKGEVQEWIEDRRLRSERFREITRSGAKAEQLLMIRSIYLRGVKLQTMKKKLNAADESSLKLATRLVREEFAPALGIPAKDVGRYIRAALELPDTPGLDEE